MMKDSILSIAFLALSLVIFYKGYSSLNTSNNRESILSSPSENQAESSKNSSTGDDTSNYSNDHSTDRKVSSVLAKAAVIHNFGCWSEKNRAAHSDGESIRFSLKICDEKLLKSIPIESALNSKISIHGTDVLSVYDKNTSTIASEFFPLQKGENPVSISLWKKEKKIWQTQLIINH